MSFDEGKKDAGVQLEYSNDQILDLAKSAESFEYFTKFIKIVTDNPTNSNNTIDLRDYQKEMAEMFVNNRFSIVLSSRQSGKCCLKDTNVTIKHPIYTKNMPKQVKLGDFYKMVKNKNFQKV